MKIKDPAKSQRTLENKNHFRYKYPPMGMHSGVDFEDFLSSSPEAFKYKNEDQEDQVSLKQEKESPTTSNPKQTTKQLEL